MNFSRTSDKRTGAIYSIIFLFTSWKCSMYKLPHIYRHTDRDDGRSHCEYRITLSFFGSITITSTPISSLLWYYNTKNCGDTFFLFQAGCKKWHHFYFPAGKRAIEHHHKLFSWINLHYDSHPRRSFVFIFLHSFILHLVFSIGFEIDKLHFN